MTDELFERSFKNLLAKGIIRPTGEGEGEDAILCHSQRHGFIKRVGQHLHSVRNAVGVRERHAAPGHAGIVARTSPSVRHKRSFRTSTLSYGQTASQRSGDGVD
jgi:hypothetical protein